MAFIPAHADSGTQAPSAFLQANKAGADEALMLDPHGFVATCNSTNFFVVRGGEVSCTGCARGGWQEV